MALSLGTNPDPYEIIAAIGAVEQREVYRVRALQPARTATVVRVRDGKVSVRDGPFAETKELLAGFYLIDAADLNEAVQLASQIPPAHVGTIEVRPARELTSTTGERRRL
jgi:hypothetical protein